MAGPLENPQALLARARAMLTEQGAPLTAENLNRAMLGIVRPEGGTSNGQDIPRTVSSEVDRAVNNGVRPGTRTRMANTMSPTPTADGPQRPEVQLNAGAGMANDMRDRVMAADPNAYNGTYAATPGSQDVEAAMQRNGPTADQPSIEDKVAGSLDTETSGQVIEVTPQNTTRRGGTVNGASRISEADPTAGMFDGAPVRQADETGVDQAALGMGLLAPFAAAGGAAGIGPLAARLMSRPVASLPSGAGAAPQALTGGANPLINWQGAIRDMPMMQMQRSLSGAGLRTPNVKPRRSVRADTR